VAVKRFDRIRISTDGSAATTAPGGAAAPPLPHSGTACRLWRWTNDDSPD